MKPAVMADPPGLCTVTHLRLRSMFQLGMDLIRRNYG